MVDAPSAEGIDAVASPVETVYTIEIPPYKPDLYELIRVKRLRVIQAAAQHSKTRELTDQHRRDLRAVFGLLNNIDMTPELKKATLIDKAMDVIMNTTLFNFPVEFQVRAKNLKEYWEAQNWGAGEIVEDEDSSEDEEDSKASAGDKKSREVKERRTTMYRPHRTHPIFGENGIMHDILISRGKTLSYSLDDTAQKKIAAVFGNNGIHVGTCWPLQIAALRDGAHGAKVGGIHGKVNEGAYSVVVSGMYTNLDQDHGDLLFYSGSGSHENEDPEQPKMTNGTKSLQASIGTGKPVRVLRNSSGDSQYAPAAGLRYDGLYQVKSYVKRKNDKGGAYLQFRLERCTNQPAIALDRPTREERRQFEMVKAGY